ncbi:MAG: response regulator [Spirochaetales bacterium]|nr:response regulator [Spirochaetales bacterium]
MKNRLSQFKLKVMSIYAIISLLSLMIYLFFGGAIFAKNTKQKLNQLVMFLCLVMALRTLVEFGYRYSPTYEIAQFWWRLDIIWPFAAVIFFQFAVIYADFYRGLLKKVVYFVYISGICISALEIFTDFNTGPPIKVSWGYIHGMAEIKILSYITEGWFFLIGIATIVVFLVYLKRTDMKLERKHTKIVIACFSAPLVVSIINNMIFRTIDLNLPGMTNTAFAIALFPLAYAVYKYRVFDINPQNAINDIVATMSDSLILLDPDAHIKYMNHAAYRMLEYKEQELFEKPLQKIFPGKREMEKNLANPKKLLERDNVKYAETAFKTKAGQVIPVSLSLSKIFIGKAKDLIGMVCIVRDITERRLKDRELSKYRNHLEELVKRRTVKLKETKDRYISLFKDSPIPLLETDFSGIYQQLEDLKQVGVEDIVDFCMQSPLSALRILKKLRVYNVNKATLTLFEAANKNELRHNLHVLIRKETFTTMIEILLALSHGRRNFETRGIIYTLKGNKRYIYIRFSRPQIKFTDLSSVLISCIDITREKQAEEVKANLEEQLRHSQKMEAIGTLAGGLAHDFNNLLSGVLGYADLAKMDLDPGSAVYRDLEIIERTADRAAALVKQLLSFARKGKKHNVPFDLHIIIDEVITILKHTIDKRIKLTKRFKDRALFIVGDPGQMEQVIMNLAVNSRDAMPEGGELVFATDIVHLDKEFCKNNTGANPGFYSLVSIKDTGGGIPENIKSRIFEPFFTTKEQGKGTGMGLAVAYGIVTNHCGFMEVESGMKTGTTFKLYLPLQEPERRVSAKIPTKIAVEGSGGVMVVDDEDVVCEVMERMLKGLGYNTYVVKNGQEAVEYYSASKDTIDLVLIDMIMPKMNGRDCYRALKEINPAVKAVLITGHIPEDMAYDAINDGMKDVIFKPFSKSRLAQVVHAVINE